jgi:hypothetical protein
MPFVFFSFCRGSRIPNRRTLDEGSGNQTDRLPIATTGPGQDAWLCMASMGYVKQLLLEEMLDFDS